MNKYINVGWIVAVDSMKQSIKMLGQKKCLDMINGTWLVLTDEQKKRFKKIFFQAVHELEG